MTILEKFQKLDHTCCMNSDKMEYGLSDCDCSSIDEMVDILEDVEKALKAFQKIKERIGIRGLMEDFDYLFDHDEYELIKEAME